MVVSCLSLNTSRYVACYLDFSRCSIASVLRDGLSLRFSRVFAILINVFSDLEEVFSEV